MNTYTARALMAEAIEGARVLVVSHSGTAVRDAFSDFDALAATAGAESVRRANGAQQIRFASGGCVFFTAASSRHARGLAVDVVFVDWDVETELRGEQLRKFYDNVVPCLASSSRHELVRA